MLPICWILAPLLGLLAQSQALHGRPLEDRVLQSTLFLALFLACMGLMGVRVVLSQALEEHRPGRAVLIAVLSLVSSLGLIAYGVSTML